MNYSRKQYRYILTGYADFDSKICDYKLVSQNHFPDDTNNPITQTIRFLLPDNLKLKKVKGSFYSITKDTRSLREIDAKLTVKMNGRWKESPFGITLDNSQPYNIMPVMMQNNYFITPMGYLDKNRYTYYVNHYALEHQNETDYLKFNKAYKKHLQTTSAEE